MNRFTQILALLLLLSSGLWAQKQSFTGYIEAGDRAAQQSDYYTAFKRYEIAADKDYEGDRAYEDRIAEVYYKAGLNAYRAGAYGETEKYMLKLQQRPEVSRYTLAKYYIGEAAFRLGNYDQAAITMRSFLDDQPGAPEKYRSTALERIGDANWAIDAEVRGENIVLNHLTKGINSADSDVNYIHGPKGSRYFTTNHDFEFKNDTIEPHRQLTRIMVQTGEASAKALPELINLPGKNVAHAAFTPDFQRVYYQVCDFREQSQDELICDLYSADVDAEGEWSNPQKLDINQAGYSTAMPNVGQDLASGDTYLYFSSDRPGGKGMMDLYRAKLAGDGKPASPENLEEINTREMDVTPFWYAPRNTLYFSTDGRFTFGGLDVYKSYRIAGSFREPVNVGTPINSSAEDAYYTRFDDTDQAYVASRRYGEETLYYDEEREVCCHDLYSFTPDPRIDLQVLTFNGLTKKDLIGVTVALYRVTPNGPELVKEITNLDDNVYNFLVEPGAKYEVKAIKDGFSDDLDAFDLGSNELKDLPFIERKMYLNPTIKLDVFTFNNVDASELVGVSVKLYEVDEDGNLTLVREITNPDGNDAHFDLEIGKNYRVEADKPGFGEAYTTIDLREFKPDQGGTIRRDLFLGQSLEVYVIDGRTDEPLSNATLKLIKIDGEQVDERTNPDGNDFYYTVNLDQPFVLSTSRPDYFPRTDTLRFTREDLVDGGGKLVYYVPLFSDNLDDFLPFDVYFDNDHPNPDAYTSKTDLTYPETYDPYIDKEQEFKELAAKGLSEQDAFVARGNIGLFFDQNVKAGWEQLQRFSDALIQHLRNGRSFTVELQGYASPRAPSEYNRRLSARRNMCLRNFFQTYRKGAMAGYVKNGQLDFREAALGERTANLDRVYELLDNERESIYSQLASLERRVSLKNGLSVQKKK